MGAAALLFATGLSAQGEFNTTKGDIGLLGGLTFGSAQSGTSDGSPTFGDFGLCLGGYYSLSDAWAAGLMVDFNSSSSSAVGSDDSIDNSQFLIGPAGRRYFGCGGGLNTFVGADVMFGSSTTTSNVGGSSTESSVSHLTAGLDFGLQYAFNDKVAAELNFGGLRYSSSEADADGAEPNTDFSFTALSKGVEVGFMWFPFSGE